MKGSQVRRSVIHLKNQLANVVKPERGGGCGAAECEIKLDN
jgi:hypothetical protein